VATFSDYRLRVNFACGWAPHDYPSANLGISRQWFDQTRRDHEQQFGLPRLKLGAAGTGRRVLRISPSPWKRLMVSETLFLHQAGNDEAFAPIVKLPSGIATGAP